ncbi:MAG: pirin family protein [Bacteroidia bacterium]
MDTRTVKYILPAYEIEMGELRVKQAFPTQKVDYPDPFLLLHHARFETDPDIDPKHQGVSPHPHRGFSPVTFIFEGGVHHRDSRGNNSVVYENGVQWMNAGMGIMHSERPPRDIAEHGGVQELIQMWVNTPAVSKMKQPEYFAVNDENVPKWKSPNGTSVIRIFSGLVNGIHGPVNTPTPVNSATIELSQAENIQIEVPENHTAFVYLLDGKINIPGYGQVEAEHAVFFNNDAVHIGLQGMENTRLLFMSGKPLNEPMASRGPFVMSNETELLVAMRDYRMGKMGILIED